MIGLGVGIDYALFIVTRFRENYLALGDVGQSVMEAMDTSGRAILLAGTTVRSPCSACSPPASASCTGWRSPRCSPCC